jgi:hypothetical protein
MLYNESMLLPLPKKYGGGNYMQNLKDWIVEIEILRRLKDFNRAIAIDRNKLFYKFFFS